MKKRTLNQTWVLCLLMWRWIAANWKEGDDVEILKAKWLYDNGFLDLEGNCFFCEWDSGCSCRRCPGKLVDFIFICDKPDYCYYKKPKDFYKELLRLNRIRKGKK